MWRSLCSPTLSFSAGRFLSGAAAPSSTSEKLFDKILIANRGEICLRVIKTARRLGIKTVAIYSEPDRTSCHVLEADEAVCVGPAASADSYLNIPNIMEAIRQTGAQAVHPGYGFLSENATFAEALAAEGVAFIGPNTRAIQAMGDKIESKQLARDAKVNTVPGFLGLVESTEDVLRISGDIGYPVMIKASAGGGGKGMRVAWNDEEAAMGFRLSKEEAASSFGDDRIFIEKFIEDPRHIEIQLLGDKQGNITAFPERECSIQRRNQKVVEESPSVLLDPTTRKAMQDQAVALAAAVNYESAGTVEFLCDKDKNFYFLEMNTRLQVEHPVTEEVTGVDLVEQMIRVAAGHSLPSAMQSAHVPFSGWSLESRVYAEDPLRGFLPSIGRLLRYSEPVDHAGDSSVRVDSGVTEGSDISMFYDPMICKLVTRAETREAATSLMTRALDEYVIRGVQHNAAFLQDVYRHPRFVEGALTTGFIEEEYPDGFSGVTLTEVEQRNLVATASLMHLKHSYQAASISGGLDSFQPQQVLQLYATLPGADASVYRVDMDQTTEGNSISMTITAVGDGDGEEGEGVSVVVEDPVWSEDQTLFSALFDDSAATLQFMNRLPEGYKLSLHGGVFDVLVRSPMQHAYSGFMLPKPEVDTSKQLLSPMPGALLSVAVEAGQQVEAGQEIAVIEAMKMQNVLRAEKKGTVAAVVAAPGATLSVDQLIVEFE